ncbi:MAG: hypothetical protein KGL39_20795 [Patescibacteria group bacterium]|nr:hypothetical protein [Patescibacteria group bacterium]
MATREPTRKLVVDFPASVMEGLDKLRQGTGQTIKQLVLDALASRYGLQPQGAAPQTTVIAPEVRPVPKPGKK